MADSGIGILLSLIGLTRNELVYSPKHVGSGTLLIHSSSKVYGVSVTLFGSKIGPSGTVDMND